MTEMFQAPCECGDFVFVFERPPVQAVEVMCPRCGRVATVRPTHKRGGKREEKEE